jgi:hypothetical protein
VGKSEERRILGKPSLDGRIILKWIFEKWDGARNGSFRYVDKHEVTRAQDDTHNHTCVLM